MTRDENAEGHKVFFVLADYLLREGVAVLRYDRRGVGTFIATAEGWLYLAVIMDLASRRVVGWAMSERIKADLVCQALRMAYWRRKP